MLLLSSDNGDVVMATQKILVLLLPSLGSTNKTLLLIVLLTCSVPCWWNPLFIILASSAGVLLTPKFINSALASQVKLTCPEFTVTFTGIGWISITKRENRQW